MRMREKILGAKPRRKTHLGKSLKNNCGLDYLRKKIRGEGFLNTSIYLPIPGDVEDFLGS